MVREIHLKNFGIIGQLDCNQLGPINLIIGPNQSGKTTLVKSLYAAIRTTEQYKRGKENRLVNQILSDKLYWTFQTNSLGNLVKKGENEGLSFKMCSLQDGEEFSYSFSSSATKLVSTCSNSFSPTNTNSIFIPAKEVLSLREIILDSRNRYMEFGFEDPYLDLVRAFRPATKGKNYKAFSVARQELKNILHGEIAYSKEKNDWLFIDSSRRVYEVAMTSEGVKKLSILSALLGNRYLSNKSIVIIDEVESNLHPSMISKFMEIIVLLADAGIQFFLTSHSYFVIKKLYILAHKHNMDIPVISFNADGSSEISNLKTTMPKNAIIDESIELYKEEINL